MCYPSILAIPQPIAESDYNFPMKAIVLVINGVHVGWLGPYGNEWVRTFNLDKLAAESVLFDQHFSDHPDLETAWKSLWTGQYQLPELQRDSPHGSLPKILQSHQIRTILVHDREDNSLPTDDWDIVMDALPEENETAEEALLSTIEAGVDFLLEQEHGLLWIETNRLLPPWDINMALYAEYAMTSIREEATLEDDEESEDDMEGDYEEATEEEIVEEAPPKQPVAQPLTEEWTTLNPQVGVYDTSKQEEWDFLHNSFASVMTRFDELLGEVFALFRERGLHESALWMITSGAGFPLGEHGYFGPHRPWLHEELIHIPLIVRLAEVKESGRRVFSPTQSIDLLPTLLHHFQIPIPDTIHGVNLFPLIRSEVEKVRDYTITGLQIDNEIEFALRTEHWALLSPIRSDHPTRTQSKLFEKPEDRWEVSDLKQQHFDWAEYLESVLNSFLAAMRNDKLVIPPIKDYDEIKESPNEEEPEEEE
jgi:arylsulfatase A-like enzyme